MTMEQSYEILEPFQEGELKRTASQKLALISLIVMISAGLLHWLFQNDTFQTILNVLFFVSFFTWTVALIMSLIIMPSREVKTVGVLTFRNEHLELPNSKKVLYSEIQSFNFVLNDYQGEMKQIIGGNALGRAMNSVGANNYFELSSGDQRLRFRIKLKSRKSMKHLNENVKPWLITKITGDNTK